MSLDRLRYEFRLMGGKVLWTPVLVMLGFALFALLLIRIHTSPGRFLAASLEMSLPLAAGVVVATVISQDAAIELQLTLPRKYHLTAMLRLLLIVGWTICIAVVSDRVLAALKFEYMPAQMQSWVTPFQYLTLQLVWFAPLLWFVGFGLCLALLLRSRTASGALLGGIWIMEIIFKDYLALTPWLRPVLLFPTTLIFYPQPIILQDIFDLWFANHFQVLLTALVLLPLGWLLLRNPEGLLKGSSEE